ncbi:hypothetical protein [Acidaminococcus timonensis]|uniref:hypothetical protein n=1 Tax=Acidaminococcus timonensis TaxID=1871002 RepID=UPI002665536E|nr:hypothetical protein [uncultured Acidaminococcus sp.]
MAIKRSSLPFSVVWMPEKIGALLLAEMALLTILTLCANRLLSQENCMGVPPYFLNRVID